MLTAPEFKQLLNVTGKTLAWTQAKEPRATLNVICILQSTSKAAEVIVNAFGINGTSIQLAADALPVPPEKFDTFTDANGHRYVIDVVIPHEARGTGALVSFTCYSKGK